MKPTSMSYKYVHLSSGMVKGSVVSALIYFDGELWSPASVESIEYLSKALSRSIKFVLDMFETLP